MNRLTSFVMKQIKPNKLYSRLIYTVHHNEKRGIFYLKLDATSRAVLVYKADGRVLDMLSIHVPSEHKGNGIARLLTEHAFTHCIVNYYLMYLTCEYMQKYYLAVKNPALEELVVGPYHILEGPDSIALDPDIIYDLPDPEDFMIYNS